jgi:HlyD family secretion protein
LNNVLVVTKPGTWIAMLAIAIAVIATLVWSVVGVIPTTVQAQGILARPGGLQSVAALGNGVLQRMLVDVDQLVSTGDTIALISVPDLALQLANALQQVHEADSLYRKTLSLYSALDSLGRLAEPSEKEASDLGYQAAEQRLENQQRQAESMKALLEKGLVTRNEYFTKLEELLQAQQSLLNLRKADIDDRSSSRESHYQREQEILRAEGQLTASIRRSREIELQYKQASTVLATCSGRITQISVAEGALVTSGAPVVTIESTDNPSIGAGDMLVAVFIPPDQGKKVTLGMTVHVVPTNIEASEYGSIKATTKWVSDYPMDAAGVRRFISNDAVASYFGINQQPPIGVLATLETDASNPSGFRWTSGRGPNTKITAGSVCSCSIVVEQRAPISLLLPWLMRTLGMDS